MNNHPQVEKVHHPSVSDDPEQQALYKKYFPNGGGSIFTFEIKGGAETAKKFIDNLELFSLLANVADVKSLVIHPASTTHAQLNEEELADQGIKPNTIRLSIGTENIDDIIDPRRPRRVRGRASFWARRARNRRPRRRCFSG